MTAAELIAALQKVPGDTPVALSVCNHLLTHFHEDSHGRARVSEGMLSTTQGDVRVIFVWQSGFPEAHGYCPARMRNL
jgi:hypothetical protein